MSSLNVARAMELFKEVEEKAANLRNPGGYLKEYIDQCIRQADVNSDGKIDIDEFVHLMVLHLPDARIAADTEFVTDQAHNFGEPDTKEILLFGKVRKIGIEQASNAFRGISFVCLRSLQQQGLDTSKVKLLRVYLGHLQLFLGECFTCRERFESRREADVLVDFHAPIVRRLRLWALDSATLVPVEDHEDALPTFCFETTSTERFQNLAHLMRDTAHVVDQEFCDPTQTLVLCEREWGAKEIRKLNAGFKVLSAAEIIDDLLREVRQWARHGFTGPEIQAELDRRDLQTLKVVRSAMHAARITWLNGNVFTAAPLDQEAREAAASLPLERALEILKDLEGKSTSVSNPSGYVKAAVRREPSGGKRVASMQMGPPSKRQAY
eukprot:g18380.t1